MKHKILAATLAAGIIFSMQGFTAAAGTMGMGSSAQSGQSGPGAVSQEQTGQPEGQEQTVQEQTAQEQAVREQTAQPEGQAGTGQDSLQVNYSAFMVQQGWSTVTADNHQCVTPGGTWVSVMKANLINIPAGAQVRIRYQVNLSGSGWLNWSEDGAESGDSGGVIPLESIRMELTGSSAADHDLYYMIYQNGSWTDWAANGAAADVEGAGLRVDGVRASITSKGAGLPTDIVVPQSSIDPSKPMIALTFDDGPRTAVTSRISDSPEANDARATFFMPGSNVNANAGVIRRMVEQGCEVVNHTHDHKYIPKLSVDGIVSQVGSTNQEIQVVCDVSPVLMRPPGGYIDAHSLSVLRSMGMPAIMWSIDAKDWQHRNAQGTIDTVLGQVKNGDMILMHDIYATTADAAVVLISELITRGYQLVTVNELASYRGGAAPGHKYSQFR